ncbi:MAG TPA: LCP family protein [Streptosporangiaceae bacterium]|nr:LCP family protein [Streptosporangiaceae bacterium]
MTDWPDDWFRESQGASPSGRPPAEPTVQLPYRSGGGSGWPSQPAPGAASPAYRPARAGGPGGGAGGYQGGYSRPGWRRWLKPRRILAIIAALLSLAIVASVVSYFYLDSKLTRKNVLVDYSGRPAAGAGQNWLITGSDSRQGLTRKEERKLKTGHDISGRRSDTIMVLHMPANGSRPVLISLPRDSYVPIPGHGSDKINAAYAYGGPRLLAETVQNVTGLRIDHFMSIGFGGFVRVVDAVGGVRICIKAPIVDPAAGLHLHKGCQTLDGAEALGFVRTRHTFATQDLQRIQDQRIFLRALLRKLTSAGVIANPFSGLPAASGVAGTLTVDKGTHLFQLLQVALALRNPITTTVPIEGSFVTSSGEDALKWNSTEALKLFHELNNDQPISKGLISGSKQS